MKEKPKIQSLISLKMVQRKVSNFRLGIQDSIYNNRLKSEGNHTNNTKTLLQNNHEPVKMKKSRLIKRSDTEIGVGSPPKQHLLPRHNGELSPFKTPSPQKRSQQCSPNYMKSTRSYEARKENTTKVISSSVSSASKVAKTLTKSSSFRKVRSLKKVTSVKLKPNAKTCSSTQKDAKFPPHLELKPGATEAKGKSVHRVCKYNHCSLNDDDHHNSARTPLKRFVASRRRLLKTEMGNRPEVVSPRKEKLSECKDRGAEDHQKEDFFVDIFVQDKGVDQPVSESLSDGPRSEIDLHNDQDQSEDTKLPDLMNYSLKDEDYAPSSVQSDLCDNSDLVWEEGQSLTTNDSGDIHIQNDFCTEHGKPGFEAGNSDDEEYINEFPPYFLDEIVEYLCFSDAASLPDSESTQTDETGGNDVGEPLMVEEKVEMDFGSNDEAGKEDSTLEDGATVQDTKLEEELTDNQGEILSELINEIAKARNEDQSDESDEDNLIRGIREENFADKLRINEKVETCANDGTCLFNIGDQDGSDQSQEQNDSSEVKLESSENNVMTVETSSGMGESNNGESDSNQELLDICNKLSKWMRCKKADEDVEEDREFNPRGPNFLELEPDPEAEKVDLRHQEMNERKNAEDWMLDLALQKTVNQLTPARKKKVALLVEAYETVLPV